MSRRAAVARRRRGPGPLRRAGDDGGAVAIIVALTLSTLLVGFGSLAVDLGNLYARNARSRSTADLAAVAAAQLLPDMVAARAKAVEVLCDPANAVQGWPAGACTGPDPAWTHDGAGGNGEITFYAEDPAGAFGLADLITTPDTSDPAARPQAVGIRVLLPPATVRFGLAAAAGFQSGDSVAAATARIGTPAGVGVLPFPVMSSDITSATKNRFCIRDPGPAPPSTAYPGPNSPLGPASAPTFTLTPATSTATAMQPNGIVLRANWTSGYQLPTPLADVHFLDQSGQDTAVRATRATAFQTTVRSPALDPGLYQVWIQSPDGTVVSQEVLFQVTGTIVAADPCQSTTSTRGVLASARLDGQLDLGRDVKTGLQPVIHAIQEYPAPAGPLGALAGSLQQPTTCSSLASLLQPVEPLVQVLKSVLGQPATDITCSDLQRRGFAADLQAGLLDQNPADPGRLTLHCTGGRTTDHGVDIDNTRLFGGGSNPLVNPAFGTPRALQTSIESNGTPTEGAITDAAFQCPRLGLVPIMNPLSAGAAGSLPADDAPIVGYTYAWIDNPGGGTAGGLVWSGTNLQSVRAHIIDPGYFDRLVTGSPVVTEYLGDNLPKEVVLVRDIGDP